MTKQTVAAGTLVTAAVLLFVASPAMAMEKPKFDSGNLTQGQSFSWHTTESGTWEYHCKYHSSMAGKITVTSGDGMGQTVEVAIQDNKFVPAEVTVPVGGDIKWTNMDARNHTVTSADDSMMKDDGMMSDDDMMDDTMEDGGDAPGLGLLAVLAVLAIGVIALARRR